MPGLSLYSVCPTHCRMHVRASWACGAGYEILYADSGTPVHADIYMCTLWSMLGYSLSQPTTEQKEFKSWIMMARRAPLRSLALLNWEIHLVLCSSRSTKSFLTCWHLRLRLLWCRILFGVWGFASLLPVRYNLVYNIIHYNIEYSII